MDDLIAFIWSQWKDGRIEEDTAKEILRVINEIRERNNSI